MGGGSEGVQSSIGGSSSNSAQGRKSEFPSTRFEPFENSFVHSQPRPKMCEAIRCDFGAICELGDDGFPRCTCQFNCTFAPGSPVCASDLKLYETECEMRREACHRQTELRPRPMELCEGIYIYLNIMSKYNI